MWRAIRIGSVGVDRPEISNRNVMPIASGTREWTLNNVPKSHSNKEKESDQTSSAVTLISISVDSHVASFHSDKIHIELSHNLIRFYSKEFRSGISIVSFIYLSGILSHFYCCCFRMILRLFCRLNDDNYHDIFFGLLRSICGISFAYMRSPLIEEYAYMKNMRSTT